MFLINAVFYLIVYEKKLIATKLNIEKLFLYVFYLCFHLMLLSFSSCFIFCLTSSINGFILFGNGGLPLFVVVSGSSILLFELFSAAFVGSIVCPCSCELSSF